MSVCKHGDMSAFIVFDRHFSIPLANV